MSDKYTAQVARTIAERIYSKYRAEIVEASKLWLIPEHWLAGLTGMENPQCREYPDKRSYRFERGVYAKLLALRNGSRTVPYNGITRSHVSGLSDAAIRNLSISFGQTQIMAYYVLTLLKGVTVAQLRDPKKHYLFTGRFLNHDPFIHKYVKQGNFAQVCHIWNSGRVWDGTNAGIKTHSPYYMYNCNLVAQSYAALIAEEKRASVGKAKAEVVPVENIVTTPQPEASKLPPANSDIYIEAQPVVEETTTGAETKQSNQPNGDNNMSIFDETFKQQGHDPSTHPSTLPGISVKPGITTSQGQLTFLFTIASVVLSYLGWVYSPEQIAGLYEQIVNIITIIVPLIAGAWSVINYTNSRGKIYSNAITSTALMNSGGLGSIFGSIFGGKDWKDPARYGGILNTVEKLPIPGVAGKVVRGAEDFITATAGERIGPGMEDINKIEGQLSDLSEDVVNMDERLDATINLLKTMAQKMSKMEDSITNMAQVRQETPVRKEVENEEAQELNELSRSLEEDLPEDISEEG